MGLQWHDYGTTAQLHARWLQLIGKSPLGGDLPKNKKRKKHDSGEDDEDDEEEVVVEEGEQTGCPERPEGEDDDEQMEDFEVSKVVSNRWDVQFNKLEATNYFEVKWTKGDLLSVSGWLFVAL